MDYPCQMVIKSCINEGSVLYGVRVEHRLQGGCWKEFLRTSERNAIINSIMIYRFKPSLMFGLFSMILKSYKTARKKFIMVRGK